MLRVPLGLALCLLCSCATSDRDAPRRVDDTPGRHVHTDRKYSRVLPLPKQDDCFFFAIYGDRTGGQPSGLKVLRQAVRDTNILDPDLVMTVGDLIQGYNQPEQWLEQAREFKAIMDDLRMPWFPVAGNHDTYGPRDKVGRLFGEHADRYEQHFGPLWYWFEHKNCAFVVLYTDEGDPKTGRVDFRRPELQKMSPEQLAWLEQSLQANRGRDHVFVFLHHPRWRTDHYGDDWNNVHEVLAAAGNVRAVFAGHIHRMQYAGVRDGIEYFTLATTGGGLSKAYPERAGYLHHFNLVTVRKDGIRVSTLPVGAVVDPTKITRKVSDEVRALTTALKPPAGKPLRIADDGSVTGRYSVEVQNPTTRPVELTVIPEVSDGRFMFGPDHRHWTLAPGARAEIAFAVRRPPAAIDPALSLPRLRVQADYLAQDVRISLREHTLPVPCTPPRVLARTLDRRHLDLGRGGFLRAHADKAKIDGDALTVECFVRCAQTHGRRGLIADRRFHLALDAGRPEFRVRTNLGTATIAAPDALSTDVWHHVAGVFDRGSLRIYVDGKLAAEGSRSGTLNPEAGQLLIGATLSAKRRPVDFARAKLDEVRISTVARYVDGFTVPDRQHGFAGDKATALLLHCDGDFGPWLADHSTHHVQPVRVGVARCRPDEAVR